MYITNVSNNKTDFAVIMIVDEEKSTVDMISYRYYIPFMCWKKERFIHDKNFKIPDSKF